MKTQDFPITLNTLNLKPLNGPKPYTPKFGIAVEDDATFDDDDEEDFAQTARKKLGIPDFDPSKSLLAILPSIVFLGPNRGVSLVLCHQIYVWLLSSCEGLGFHSVSH